MADMNFDIFNLDDSQMKIKTSSKQTSNTYSPKFSDGKDNTYTAILRFLPNPEDPYHKSSIKKINYWMDVPELELRGYFDCPSTVDKESAINKKYWELKNKGDKGDARAEKNAKKIGNRNIQFYSYVLIVKDPQKPELENTVQVFKYPNFIKKLIDEQEDPKGLEGFEDAESCNIFNPMTGKNFKLQISKKGDWATYEGSKFSDKREPVKIGGESIKTSKEAGSELKKQMTDCKSKLSEFEYKEWTEEEEEKIMKYLKSLSSADSKSDSDDDMFFDDEPKDKKKADTKKADSKKETKKEEADDFDLDFDEPKEKEKTTNKSKEKEETTNDDFDLDFEEPKEKEKVKEDKKKADTKKADSKKETKKEEADDDLGDLDDFLNDL